MAKKVVATLKSADSKQYTKVINMVKNAKGSYSFEAVSYTHLTLPTKA